MVVWWRGGRFASGGNGDCGGGGWNRSWIQLGRGLIPEMPRILNPNTSGVPEDYTLREDRLGSKVSGIFGRVVSAETLN